MFSKYEAELAQLAVDAYPEEGVWFITEDGIVPVKNIHPDPENHFEVDPADTLAAYRAGLLAVVHSHPDREPVPSKADMEVQVRTGVPWGIVSVRQGVASPFTWWGGNTPKLPLLGRPFMHGPSDCYAVVKDFYHAHGIELAEVPREWMWWEEEELFDLHWADFGFHQISITEARKGDVWLCQIRTPFESHCGVMLDSERTLHHPGSSEAVDPGKLSVIEPIYRYLPYVTKALRHKDSDKFLEKEVQL